ncbi:anti-sigma factor family protein [Pedococcus sp. NPDC057267]|uniref:anti-sigma factor family protein n=1 Tax=Pedococcus sp. NPDC057267 TaxID=3346077 RepID=UPI00363302FB
MSGTDAYADWDAAYVLGAMGAPDRMEYEAHLTGCPRCQAAVAELAGVPGLLAQVPPGEALALDEAEGEAWPQPPSSLMPVLPREPLAARERPRGLPRVLPHAARGPRWVAFGLAAALVLGALAGYAVSAVLGDRSPGPVATATSTGGGGVAGGVAGGADATRLAFSPVQPSLMTAVVDVVPVASGTELRVECQYARSSGGSTSGGTDGRYQGEDGVAYAIWVVDRSGAATELHAWTARPDLVMRPVGRSDLPVGRIGAVEIRRVTDGATVMRARLS